VKNKYLRVFAVLAVAAVVPFLSGCWEILNLDQRASVDPGEKITTTFEIRIEGEDDNPHFGILGLLIPEDWEVDSVYYSGDFGPDFMSFLHPDSADGDPGGLVDYWNDSLEVKYPPPAGMNWIVYQAETAYAHPTGPEPDTNFVDMTIDMTVGATGGDFNIGYFVTNAAWDFSSEDYYAISLDNPINVSGPPLGPVNVTFRVNTSTSRDTVSANSVVQLRGTTQTAAGQTVDDGSVDVLSPTDSIQWNGKSTMFLNNVGGDYWQATFEIPRETKLAYKIFVNASHDTVYGGADWEHQGWENDLTPVAGVYGTNRFLDLSGFAGTDTTLDLQFYAGGWKDKPMAYEKPYTTNDSTDVVYVRVNFAGWDDFNPSNHTPAIRGGLMPGSNPTPSPQLDWGTSWALTQEGATKFYSAPIYIQKGEDVTGVRYKAVVHAAGNPLNEDWGQMVYNPDTQYERNISVTGDTTLLWTYFNNLVPKLRPNPDEVVITYSIDMSKSIMNRGFAHGDTVYARAGYFGTATEVYEVRLTRQGFSNVYGGKDTIFTAIGEELDYQYYVEKRGEEVRESYFDFDYEGTEASEAERRRIIVTSADFAISDVVDSKVDSRRQPFFRNTSILAQSVKLTMKCDVRPAIFQVLAGDVLEDIQGTRNVSDPDSILKWGVWVNGPLTGGWQGWGGSLASDTTRQLYDDGTHGDATANDSIYTRILYLSPDSTTFSKNVVGQEFKFGIYGGDNESGFGLNHIENVDDSGPEAVFDIQFGSINPNRYDAWDFDNRKPIATGVASDAIPYTYSLEQNYPNPFNPETSLSYSLAKPGKVNLVVYNIMGQKVKTLVDKERIAGKYTITWDGRNDHNKLVSTGVYFYKIKAGDFSQIKKMLFVK